MLTARSQVTRLAYPIMSGVSFNLCVAPVKRSRFSLFSSYFLLRFELRNRFLFDKQSFLLGSLGEIGKALFGQRPRREPEGTKSCRIQGESVRTSVRPYIHTSVRPPPQGPL